MSYSFPDEETLAKYLTVLGRVLAQARRSAHSSDPQMEQLLDAVHNIPDLLCRWDETRESWVIAELEAYEARYCRGADPFSGVLKRGVDPGANQVWRDDRGNDRT